MGLLDDNRSYEELLEKLKRHLFNLIVLRRELLILHELLIKVTNPAIIH